MSKRKGYAVSDNYCPKRAWDLGTGDEIKFPEEHTLCGKKRCCVKGNRSGVFKEGGNEPQVR
jgi:hypothetical protein